VVPRAEIEGANPVITLGFNYSQMHDSSACIARDGELLFAVAEERISRIKHDAGFPHNAIRACLEFAKVRPDQLDAVCAGWPAPSRVFATDVKCFLRGQYPITYLNVLNSARLTRTADLAVSPTILVPRKLKCVLWIIIWRMPSARTPIRVSTMPPLS
jgi:predicted NodU family carbamoyl transferase